jgi:hypothetical protein
VSTQPVYLPVCRYALRTRFSCRYIGIPPGVEYRIPVYRPGIPVYTTWPGRCWSPGKRDLPSHERLRPPDQNGQIRFVSGDDLADYPSPTAEELVAHREAVKAPTRNWRVTSPSSRPLPCGTGSSVQVRVELSTGTSPSSPTSNRRTEHVERTMRPLLDVTSTLKRACGSSLSMSQTQPMP